MSLATLKADPRYRDAVDALRSHEAQGLRIENPALADGRHAIRTEVLQLRLLALSGEHGWNVERQEWMS